ncbi:cytochrome b/b6 domain-containing protein [Breoghania sp.]|uniref:cytochrome b n=1 Tax=Breoghania sp. TaxID=2065378 RepID=UPI002D1E3B32|nr:cytochrome b/b6 domain-containing protein [Breoghania sp.]
MLRNSKSGYGLIAILFHWSMALLMFGVFGLGLYMHELPQFEERTFALYQLHKSFGFTILALVVLRLMWRFANPAPRLPGAMPLWKRPPRTARMRCFMPSCSRSRFRAG